MSILDAIKQMKQQTGSLDELASLPQTMIMQMVQTGQINETQLGPILNRKAELADMRARIQATSRGNIPPMSVMEQLMAKNAQAEQPRQMQDMGVAQLPIRDDMYDEQRMAGGGIVAFQNNLDQPISEDMPATYEESPYLSFDEKLRAMQMGGNPFMMRQPSLFSRGVEAVKQLPAQLSRLQPKPITSEQVRRRMPAEPITGSEQALYDAERLAKESKRTAMPTINQAGQVIAPQEGTKTQKVAAAGANAAAQETGTSAIDEYVKILRQQGEDSAKARQDAKYMRLLEAGLGIMGGTSPYAFANIGQGAIGAAKGYAEDVRGMRAEERERAKTLGSLAMEKEKIAADREKTAMFERRYKEMADIDRQKISLMASQNKDAKTAQLVGQAFNTLMSEYKTRLDRGDITPSELYAQAQQMVASSLGTNVGGGTFAGPTNQTFSWSSLTQKAK